MEAGQPAQLTGTNRSIGLDPKRSAKSARNRPRAAARPRTRQPDALSSPSHDKPRNARPLFRPGAGSAAVRGQGVAGLVAMARGQAPDPIPNSAVKTLSADGTAPRRRGRVGRRQARPARCHSARCPDPDPVGRRGPPMPPAARPGTAGPARHPGAGWSSPVARQAHNLKVAGSNPAPATNFIDSTGKPLSPSGFFAFVASERYPPAEYRLPEGLHFAECDLIVDEVRMRNVHEGSYGHKFNGAAASSVVA